jgi:hypothetical protein
MTIPVTLPPSYFDAMYQAAADPWGFEDRWYEQRKYAVSLALFPAARYRSAFEPGCSSASCPAAGRPVASTSLCSPSSCTTSGITTSTKS